jgi:hypothetical protein
MDLVESAHNLDFKSERPSTKQQILDFFVEPFKRKDPKRCKWSEVADAFHKVNQHVDFGGGLWIVQNHVVPSEALGHIFRLSHHRISQDWL